MAKYLNLEKWDRKDHFLFFKDFEDPFFNICADVDITQALAFVRDRQQSFFLASLYLSTIAANRVSEFRYRIENNTIRVHEQIHPGSTILNENNTFNYCYFDLAGSFSEFCASAERILEQNRRRVSHFNSNVQRGDVIYYTVIPWISFTSFKHARQAASEDSIPRISFGKYHGTDQCMQMPVSVAVNHAVVDGLHVGEYFRIFQELLQQPKLSLGG